MFTPEITIKALKTMHERWGDRIYDHYGFVDAFNPNNGWVNPDVIGIDVGITLLSAENLRSGNVWRWFMRNQEIPRAMKKVGFRKATSRPSVVSRKELKRYDRLAVKTVKTRSPIWCPFV